MINNHHKRPSGFWCYWYLLSIYWSIYPFLYSIHPNIQLCIYWLIHNFPRLSFHHVPLSTICQPSIHFFDHLSVYPPVHPFICLLIYQFLFNHSSNQPYNHSSIHLFTYQFIFHFIQPIHPPSADPSTHQFFHHFIPVVHPSTHSTSISSEPPIYPTIPQPSL